MKILKYTLRKLNINDITLNQLLDESKINDLVETDTLEVKISLIVSIITIVLFYFLLKYCDINSINEIFRELSKNIALTLIGFLGFVVSGLAIWTSTISNQIMGIISKRNLISSIIRILLSFYLEGILISTLIVLLFMGYIVSYMPIEINFIMAVTFIFVCSYIFTFILFYALSLIGSCIQLFRIINNYNVYLEEKNDEKLTLNDRKILDKANIYASYEIASMKELASSVDLNKLYLEYLKKYIKKFCDSEEQYDKIARFI